MRKSRSISSRFVIGTGAVALTLLAQQPSPTCHHCQATYVPVSELDAYTAKAVKYSIIDQQVRSVNVGKSQVGVGMVTRGKLVAGTVRKGAVAEHEQVSEVYHVIEGTATLLTGPDLVNVKKRPDSEKTVRLQNGPGWNADSIANPLVHHLQPGDVTVIPAGTWALVYRDPRSHHLPDGAHRSRQGRANQGPEGIRGKPESCSHTAF